MLYMHYTIYSIKINFIILDSELYQPFQHESCGISTACLAGELEKLILQVNSFIFFYFDETFL